MGSYLLVEVGGITEIETAEANNYNYTYKFEDTESLDRSWGDLESGKLMGEHKPLFPRINSENM